MLVLLPRLCRSWMYFLQQYDQNRIALYMYFKKTSQRSTQDKNWSMVQIAITGTQSWTVKLNICCIVCTPLFSTHDFRKPCETHDRKFKLIAEKKEPKFTYHTNSTLTRCSSRGNLSWSVARLAALTKKLYSRSCTRAATTQRKHILNSTWNKKTKKAPKIKWPVNTKHFRTEINKTIKPSNVKWQQC